MRPVGTSNLHQARFRYDVAIEAVRDGILTREELHQALDRGFQSKCQPQIL